jgi:hypothetical protein
VLNKAAYNLKILKIRNLPVLANKMHERQRREKSMSKQLSVKTAVCTEYERLLKECQSASNIWNEQRAEIYWSRLRGKRVEDELRQLQAKYARAYSMLQKHTHDCALCQFVSRIEGLDSENNSDTLSESKICV